MLDIQTALQIIAKTIKDAGFHTEVLSDYKCIKVSLKNAKWQCFCTSCNWLAYEKSQTGKP